MNDSFTDKVVLVTGGTGSFGNAVVRNLIHTSVKEIRILSRDEKKQEDMRKFYRSSRLKFFLGDVREKDSIRSAVRGVDYVFHAAALKQVPSCEFFPLEAVKTNVIGSSNVVDICKDFEVRRLVCLSTDKAVYPINAMGVSKAMMERVVSSASRDSGLTKICITRYGNVMASRGSVIPLFYQQLKGAGEITITDPRMTRFMMTLDDAVNLVLFAFENGDNGDVFVQKSPGATVGLLAECMLEMYNPSASVVTLGARHGEKQHEVLLSKEERFKALDLGNYFRVSQDTRDLNYAKYVEVGNETEDYESIIEYTSFNTDRLNKDDLKIMLKGIEHEFIS